MEGGAGGQLTVCCLVCKCITEYAPTPVDARRFPDGGHFFMIYFI